MQECAYMRRLHATIGWRLSGRTGEVLDPRVVDLVALAAEHGSLAAAARAAGLPYRTAWALVAGADDKLKGNQEPENCQHQLEEEWDCEPGRHGEARNGNP